MEQLFGTPPERHADPEPAATPPAGDAAPGWTPRSAETWPPPPNLAPGAPTPDARGADPWASPARDGDGGEARGDDENPWELARPYAKPWELSPGSAKKALGSPFRKRDPSFVKPDWRAGKSSPHRPVSPPKRTNYMRFGQLDHKVRGRRPRAHVAGPRPRSRSPARRLREAALAVQAARQLERDGGASVSAWTEALDAALRAVDFFAGGGDEPPAPPPASPEAALVVAVDDDDRKPAPPWRLGGSSRHVVI